MMTGRPLTPERARRDLRHLYRLRERDNVRSRVQAAWRAAAGFGAGLWLATKAIVAKSIVAKLVLAAFVGLSAAFPVVMAWTVVWVSLAALAIVLISCLIGEAVPCADCIHCGNTLPPNDCDTRSTRRRKLDAMISVRERLLDGVPLRKK